MEALLLAAGMGTRLKDKTTILPKSLLELDGKPILGHIFSTFENVSAIQKVTVVTGFEREKIQHFLSKLKTRLEVREVWNPDFKKGNFYSVEAGLKNINAPFFITNADHIFPAALLSKILTAPKMVSAVCDFDRKLTTDCMKVFYENRNGIKSIQRIHKKLDMFNAGYIGMTVVSKDGYDHYLNAFAKVRKQGQENAYAEQVLQELAENPETPPGIIDASGFGWLEVDTAEDLEFAQKTFQDYPKFLEYGRK